VVQMITKKSSRYSRMAYLISVNYARDSDEVVSRVTINYHLTSSLDGLFRIGRIRRRWRCRMRGFQRDSLRVGGDCLERDDLWILEDGD